MTYDLTKRVVKQMHAQGNQPGLIRIFKDEMTLWQQRHEKSLDGLALAAWLPHFHPRPFYSARELSPIIPALVLIFGLAKKMPPRKSICILYRELIFSGLPLLRNASGTVTFRNPATETEEQFFIVERIHHWRGRAITQEMFEAEFTK